MKNGRSHNFTPVEKNFMSLISQTEMTTAIPYITVENFPQLGLLTACKFLEWVSENPDGVISLPTGKTPEFFIHWTKRLLNGWNKPDVSELREKFGLDKIKKPDLSQLRFVQIDEFYPIAPEQTNSFYHYVNHFYLDGFGLDAKRSLLMNSADIPLAGGRHFSEVFPDLEVDLSLRYREPESTAEEIRQQSIFLIDKWCTDFEQRIREIGGIGFFLGGMGPDGHIAFNIRGSDHHSTTRLTDTNFETKAVAAGDLGGIEVSSRRLVITIGLGTITYNPNATAIIIAAGEAKAEIIKRSLESEPTNLYPATVLQKLPNAKFYLTRGAASFLSDSINQWFRVGKWNDEKTDRAVIDYCKKNEVYGSRVRPENLQIDPYTALIPNLSEYTVDEVIDRTCRKIRRGIKPEKNKVILHTGPHHDDISLGILPYINQQLLEESNEIHFAVMTSGFTAVTNNFLTEVLRFTKKLLMEGKVQMVEYDDFFDRGYKMKIGKDVYHFLTNVADENAIERKRGLAHRLVRSIVHIYGIKNINSLVDSINDIISILRSSYDGEKNPAKIQSLKGMIREFEEELVWAHFGVPVQNVHHLRLGFYTGDIFTQQPEKKRDVEPILELLRKINPDQLSLTLDPEGSGPDTHYKVLQATAEAVRLWSKEKDLTDLSIVGYRNVWYQFHPSEANVIIPVSLSDMSVMEDSFSNCYLSQVNASFPSYRHNGKFSTLARKTWVEQLKQLQLLLGKNYFYQHENARVRASHGLIYFKEMNVDKFLTTARELEKRMDPSDVG
ncbi:MAG: glucosamine-6-phosphate isomerase [Saprospirales bacterium]|nr:MAG: glucosamine-6-phosphate isomerase [Saprospirales bacterium]